MRPRWGKDQPAVDAFDRQGDADGTADRVRQVHHLADTISRAIGDRKSTRLNSSHSQISYAVVCLTKKKFELPGATVAERANSSIRVKSLAIYAPAAVQVLWTELHSVKCAVVKVEFSYGGTHPTPI